MISQTNNLRDMESDRSDILGDTSQFNDGGDVCLASSRRKIYEEEAGRVAAKISKENKAVWGFRLLTTAVLVGVAIAVCLIVALNVQNNQKQAFKTAFRELGGQLVTTFESHLLQRIGVVNTFATELTIECKSRTNCSWPFFTPAAFELRASHTAKLAELNHIYLLPRVESLQKKDWEAYAQGNKGWIEEGLIQQGKPQPINVKPFVPYMFYFANVTRGKITFVETPGPYFPVWTQYPATEQTFTNFDPYANGEAGKNQIDAVIETDTASFPRSIDFLDRSPEDLETDFTYQRIKLTSPDYVGDPFYTGYYPVYEQPDSPFLEEEKEVAAVLMGGIRWKTYFESVLPVGTKPILVILENQCNQMYTYEVGGSYSRFLDFGDHHHPKYDPMELSTNVNAVIGMDPDKFKLSLGNCNYSIRVYPSTEFEDDYRSDQALRYSLALAGVFIFTCAVFLMYDYWVGQRQKRVMKAALQSGKLVASLFPSEVRDKLYQQNDSSRGQYMNASEHVAPAIATLYPETTIFFADLSGFTQWSSTRTPAEVFELLERIYGAFDKLATRYEVFKVETIGDCYVAVTGLPQPQDDHAVRMVKFAQACILRLGIVTADLARTLGKDTLDLEMRVGLHSGPVTAGVLRGERSRFQLFGDSVNTASRMESTGERTKIHCSEATVSALQVAGKGHWVTPRAEKVLAKGKGEMQTYWVEVGGGRDNSSSGSVLTTFTDSDEEGEA